MEDNFFDGFMRWFFSARRELPWRADRSLYSVLVSEFMLQQTQVSRVVEYYVRCMRAFPTLEALANASLDEVYRMWAGLGYYRRAKALWETARVLVEGGIPRGVAWEDLPGIGGYTAAAIRAFVFNEGVAVLDANVRRVIARFRGIVSTREQRLQAWMNTFVRYGIQRGYEPRDINEGFMELGALLCKRERRCFLCPLRRGCCTYRAEKDIYIVREAKTYQDIEEQCTAYLSSQGEVFLVPSERWRKGLWDVPLADGKSRGMLLGGFSLRYGVTHHRILRVVEVRALGDRGEVEDGLGRWVSLSAPQLALGSPAQRCLDVLRDFGANR